MNTKTSIAAKSLYRLQIKVRSNGTVAYEAFNKLTGRFVGRSGNFFKLTQHLNRLVKVHHVI